MKKFQNVSMYIVFSVCIFFSLISYVYMDPIATQRHGIEVWNVLFQGDILNFYEYCAEKTMCAAAYDFTLYLLFALWNFPVWIFERMISNDAQNYSFILVYGKGIVLIAWLMCLFYTKRIFDDFFEMDNRCIKMNESPPCFLATSCLLTVYSLYTGNYDCIALVFILAGTYFLFSKKKIMFILMFAVAISMKYFAFWIFIPLILLYEKNFLKISTYIILGSSLSLWEKLLFGNDAVLEKAGGESLVYGNAISSIIHAGENSVLGLGSISLCISIYIAICIYCFLQKTEDTSTFKYKCMWVCSVAWSAFFAFYPFNSYWIVLLVPCLAFVVCSSKKRLGINILLELVFSISLYCSINIKQWWIVYYGEFAQNGILDGFLRLIGHRDLDNMRITEMVFNKIGEMNEITTLINSLCITSLMALLYINRPDSKVEDGMDIQSIELLNRIRMGIHLGILVMPSILYMCVTK